MSEKKKILVIDDDGKWLSTIKMILRSDYDLTLTTNPFKATRLLKTNNYALIILDMRLPGTSGLEILNQMRETVPNLRVIILTEFPEVESAVESMKIGARDYISKGTRDLSTELKNRVKEVLEKKIASDQAEEFDDIVLKKYPSPFSYIYQELKSNLTPMERFVRQIDLFEVLLKFSSVVLICEYLNRRVHGKIEVDAALQIEERIYRLALGDWFNITNEIFRRKNQFQNYFFLDAFSSFFKRKNRKVMGELIEIRNDYLGHGAKLSDYEYENLVKRCYEPLITLLKDFQLITNFLMIHISDLKILRSGNKYKLRECVGTNPQLLLSKRVFNDLLPSNEMLLMNLGNEQFQNLHPFIVLESCEHCNQVEIFFYSKFSHDKLHYLSYKTGHTFSTEKFVNDFTDLIKGTRN